MFRGIAASGRAIRLPVHVERQLVAYKRKKTALAERFEREPSLSEIADFLMLDDAQVNEYEILALRTISIDERYLGRDGTLEPLPQGLEVDSEPKQPAALEREQEYARLRDAVYALKEPHQSVIRYRFLTDSKPPTHAEIGRKLVPPRSRQRVQRIEVEALARLRDALTPLGTARRGGR
jgi:DNA-directed RNA polymerase sigma subunit (sigma70/sigma32)